jgi:hypothetical protein
MMILCPTLEPAEQERVDHLAAAISERLPGVRVCEGVGHGEERLLNFYGLSGLMGTVRVADFLAADDADAIALIMR